MKLTMDGREPDEVLFDPRGIPIRATWRNLREEGAEIDYGDEVTRVVPNGTCAGTAFTVTAK